MLSQTYPFDLLRDLLVPYPDWHPFPRAGDREAWNRLPEATRRGHIQRGEELNYAWPSLPATLFLDFARTGNRSRYERESFARRTVLCNLVVAECMEGEGRFLDDIANGIWAICEESYWGVPAHIRMQAAGVGLPDTAEPTVDLFAGETVSLMAWTHYLLGAQLDGVSGLICPRIAREADVRVLTPCLERTDFWWMGFEGRERVNNWNPWCNSNWLTAALLLETDAERRLQAVARILRSLDRFVDGYPADGGCDEGTSYWSRAGGSLFDCLELLRSATNGAIDVYGKELIRNIGRYIYRAHIDDRYFINFADGPGVVHISGPLIFRYGRRIGDGKLAALGAYAAARQYAQSPCASDSIGRQLPALFGLEDVLEVQTTPPRVRDVWLEDIQVMAARVQEGTAKRFYMAAKGGHNAESHNHNDVGNFIVYAEGQPAIIDVGVETYTARTFSSERYQIWTMQSAYHNLPTVGGVMQQAGREFVARQVAYAADDAGAELRLDIAGAYPPEAGLERWMRRVRLNRGADVQVTDSYKLERPTEEIILSLMTPCQVSAAQPGELTLEPGSHTSACLRIHYEADNLQAEVEEVPVEDGRLQTVWGKCLRRILLRAQIPALEATWTLKITR